MSETIKAIRGMHDLLPNESDLWLNLESIFRATFESYGYKQIRTPIVEKTKVFSKAIGDVTDIVEKEMYSFIDKSDDSLSLRPEGTAGSVRLMIEHNLLREGIQKVWYQGQMFRRERPQKGRYRQFHQAGIEIYGSNSPKADAELIAVTNNLWNSLKLNNINLEINSLGSDADRLSYKKDLIKFLKQNKAKLDADSVKRLASNPLRILDSKNPEIKNLLLNAPIITDYLNTESNKNFEVFKKYLDEIAIDYTINPYLVRGLDYYNDIVFEWITADLGAQGTICGGGRYDSLINKLGGLDTPATGFAIGIERLVLLLKNNGINLENNRTKVYVVSVGDKAKLKSIKIISDLVVKIPNLIVYNDITETSFKSQFKKADKSNADFALILAEEELEKNLISIKKLRGNSYQKMLSFDEIVKILIDTKDEKNY